jgi:transposase
VEEELNSPMSTFSYNNAQIYNHTKQKVRINQVPCMAHIYLDKSKQAREESVLMQKIVDIERLLPGKYFKTLRQVEDYLEETLKTKKKFFKTKKVKGRFILVRNLAEINAERMLLGKFVIITNHHDLTREQVLALYRSKDGIEKLFLSWKQELGEKRTRTKSEVTMRGSLFINFLALIITAHITQIMTEKNIFKKSTKAELFKTLNKLKVFQLANSKQLLAEVTARQKEIFAAFNVKNFHQPSYKSTGF